MATNKAAYIGSVFGANVPPLLVKGKFQAGSTQTVKRGEILELSSGNFVPLGSDKSMAAIIAIAHEEIKANDPAGYYHIIVPRPGDLFRFALSAASAAALGASVYWASSRSVALSGTNALGDVIGDDHYPQLQSHGDSAGPDNGTTVGSTPEVTITIKAAASYYAALQS